MANTSFFAFIIKSIWFRNRVLHRCLFWLLLGLLCESLSASSALGEEPAAEVVNEAPQVTGPRSVKLEGKLQRRRFFRMIPMPARVPGDFEKLSAVMIAPSYFFLNDQELLLRVTRAIADKVPVIYMVPNEEDVLKAEEFLMEYPELDGRVEVILVPVAVSWIRDFGGIFVRRTDGSGMIVDCRYHKDRPFEDRFPVFMSQLLELPYAYLPLKLEGGNLLSNGAGVCVTTSKIIADQEVSGIGDEEIAEMLNRYLAFKNWVLPQALPGERTGHADTFIAFTGKLDAVVGRAHPGMNKSVAKVLDQAAKTLEKQVCDDRLIRVHRIPMPSQKDGMFRSYTNVLFVNGRLLVPSFSDVDPALEQEAHDVYRTLLPDWEIVSIPCDELTSMGGFLHCMTLGIPTWVDPSALMDFARDE